MMQSLIVISVGASLGAICRWGLGQALNGIFPLIPLGTLAANIIGGFCIGLAMSVFSLFPNIPLEWRLLIVTGFLGALTTFSTFSAEVGELLLQQRVALAAGVVSLHVGGSLAAMFLGMGTVFFWKRLIY